MRAFILISVLIIIFACNRTTVPEQLNHGVEKIILKWVPDDREGICSADLQMSDRNHVLVKGETNCPEARNEILSYLVSLGLECTDSMKVLPDETVFIKPYGLVTVSVANIKRSPSHSSELVSQAIMGTPVKILKRSGDWLLIQTPDSYLGWINDSGVTEMDGQGMDVWKQSERIIYLEKEGSILSSNDANVLSDIVAGSILNTTGSDQDFYEITFPDGRKGRVMKKNATVFSAWCSKVRPDPEYMSAFAGKLNGSPYLWGGTSVKAPDCSGFVKTVYFMGGVILARDASLQFLHGSEIDISSGLSDLKPGDLLFFGRQTGTGEKRITHVGFYLGNTEVIHSSGMVRINSLDSTRSNYNSYLWETLQGARRIIGEKGGKGIEYIAESTWYNPAGQ